MKNNNEKEIKKQEQIEFDSGFLEELNQLSKNLKTDDEIMYDYKSDKSKLSCEDDNTIKENELGKNIINDSNKERNELNFSDLLINQNTNDNPFKGAYNIMNSNENKFSFNYNDLMFESLDILNNNILQFNDILNKIVNLNDISKEKNDKYSIILGEILNFLIQSNLLKGTILNMKISIEESFEKNKNNLKKEEKEKYQEALMNAETIINEINKINPDKNLIMDCLFKLQKISNNIDSISFI